MGQNASIIAVDAARADDLLGALHLTQSDRPDRDNRHMHSGGVLGDRFIVWRNWRTASPRGPFDEADLARASVGLGLLVLDVSESTSFAAVREYRDGRLVWSAEAADGDEKPLALCGPVPPAVSEAAAEVRAALAAEGDPDGGDFDVPVRAFQMLTGHRYDEVDDVPYVALDGNGPPRRPFWKLWG